MTTASTSHALWHPFADMGSVDGDRMVLTRAEGPWVWDDGGRRYLDATAALWYSNLGHGRPRSPRRSSTSSRRSTPTSIFGDFANEPALELADRLAALAPTPGSRCSCGSGGGDMIETAAKIARSYHAHNGEPRRVHLIGRAGGYHGTHGVGTSVGGIAANADGLRAARPRRLQRAARRRRSARGGDPAHRRGPRRGVLLRAGDRRRRRPPPPGRLHRGVAEICARHGVLFVADCVICGFGRLGTWFGIDRWPVRPDLIAVAKGLSGGTMPIGALIVAPHVAEPFFTGRPGAPVLRHGATYAGHPACCAAANVALDIYEREELIERGRTLEEPLAAALAPLADHPLVGEVRAGLGFLAGIDVTPEALAADPGIVRDWQRACRAEGVLVRPLARRHRGVAAARLRPGGDRAAGRRDRRGARPPRHPYARGRVTGDHRCGDGREATAAPRCLEQADRLRVVADEQALGLRVVVEHHAVVLASDARGLVAAEGRAGGVLVVTVGPHAAGLDRATHAERAAAVAGPDAGAEAVHRVVGDRRAPRPRHGTW